MHHTILLITRLVDQPLTHQCFVCDVLFVCHRCVSFSFDAENLFSCCWCVRQLCLNVKNELGKVKLSYCFISFRLCQMRWLIRCVQPFGWCILFLLLYTFLFFFVAVAVVVNRCCSCTVYTIINIYMCFSHSLPIEWIQSYSQSVSRQALLWTIAKRKSDR